MAGKNLTVASTLVCPHGGQVQIISSNTRVKQGGQPLATVADSFVVTGCGFQLPGPVPSPCLSVRWLVPDSRLKILGSATLSESSVGLCLSAAQLPQGPVQVVATQQQVSGM